MEIGFCILALSLVGCAFGFTEAGAVLAPSRACHALPSRYVLPVTVGSLIAGLFLAPASGDFGADFPLLAAGAVAGTLLGRMLSPYVSVVFAFAGAEAGRTLFFSGSEALNAAVPLAWLLSFVMAALTAGIFCRIISGIIARIDMHYIRLMGWLGVIGTLLTVCMLGAVGYNVGSLVKGGPAIPFPVVAAVTVVLACLMRSRLGNRIARLLEREFDVHVGSTLGILLAVLLTSLFFSFEECTSLVGLHVTPLSPGLVAFAALLGCGIATNRRLLESDLLIRMTVAAIVTPVSALLITYPLVVFRYPDVSAHQLPEVRLWLFVLACAVSMILMAGYALRSYFLSRDSSQTVREKDEQLEENRRMLNRMEVKTIRTENERLHNQLELKRQEVMNIALNINEQKEFMGKLYEQVKAAQAVSDAAEKDRLLGEIRTELGQRMNFAGEIDSFYTQVESLHRDFCIRLTEKFPRLTEQERRLTILLRLGFSTKYIAALMNISPKSAEIGRHRLRAKLGLTRQQNLANFIRTI